AGKWALARHGQLRGLSASAKHRERQSDTIMSRAVIIRMQRRAAGEVVEPYRRRLHDKDTDLARGLIEAWANTFPAEIESWPELPAGIEDRDAVIWEPLIAIAEHIGVGWPERHLRIRLEPNLLERLEKSREMHGRTLTGEIAVRLEGSFDS